MGCDRVLVWGQVSDLPDFERFLATDLDENVAAILPAGETHLRTLCKITESIFLVLLAFSAFAQQPTQPTAAQESLQKWRESKWVILRDDFGELGRYREANAALKPPAPGENRVIFFGDSITDLWKLDEYFRDKPYINRGIGGQTTPQMLVRFRQDAINLQPRVVVILAGTNDIAGNTGPMLLEDIEAHYAIMRKMPCTATSPNTPLWLPWHRQRLDAHRPAGPNPTVPFCPVHVGQTSSSGQTGPSPAGKIHSSAVPKFLTSRAVLGRAGEDAHPYAVLVRPPLTSIIKVSFRPPRPLGIPWLRRRGMGLDAVPRVRVETPAPPVLGKETAGLTSAFLSPF